MRAIMRELLIARAIDIVDSTRYCNSMKKKQVIDYFGTQQKAADALGLEQPSVANWRDPLPALRQLQYEMVTGGKLKADPHCKLPQAAAP